MKRYGFTLIELLIVIGIIGTMAAITIPKFARLIGKSTCNARPYSQECIEFKARLAKSGERWEPIKRDETEPVVKEINDKLIEYHGQVWKKVE